MSRGYLVLGTEGSGTRLMTRLLIAAGCVGSAEHSQPFDNDIERGHDAIVWRRSFPHGAQEARHWPSIFMLAYRMRQAGYRDLQAVVMLRDMFPSMQSQVKTKHVVTVDESRNNIHKFYHNVFSSLCISRIPYIVVTYSGLVNHTESMVRWITTELRLAMPKLSEFETIVDADTKHWGSL